MLLFLSKELDDQEKNKVLINNRLWM